MMRVIVKAFFLKIGKAKKTGLYTNFSHVDIAKMVVSRKLELLRIIFLFIILQLNPILVHLLGLHSLFRFGFLSGRFRFLSKHWILLLKRLLLLLFRVFTRSKPSINVIMILRALR